MTKEQITERKQKATEQFDTLEKSKKIFSDKIQECLSEQIRLQGEYRILTELEAQLDAPVVADNAAPIAEVPQAA